MKIIKKSNSEVKLEGAHGGAGSRKLYVKDGELNNIDFEAMTYGFLAPKGLFDWHEHKNTDEIMFVIKGEGTVSDEDGSYEYKNGDLFIFPENTKHKIENTSNFENEYIFFRIRTRKNDSL